MISSIRIQNFKSVVDLTLKPGRVTVLIGENGSGKSNILEAIAFAAAAAAGKLDNEFLFNRGIRVTEADWMRSAFPNPEAEIEALDRAISISMTGGEGEPVFESKIEATTREEDWGFAGWKVAVPVPAGDLEDALKNTNFTREIETELEILRTANDDGRNSFEQVLRKVIALSHIEREKERRLAQIGTKLGISDFIIYAPENTVLRTPPPEGAIEPLGTKGEGLFKLLNSFNDPKFEDRLKELKERLHLFGWFENFVPPDHAAMLEARLLIKDRWIANRSDLFDQRSANEGFLYLLFYFTLLLSWRTPKFFAIDNIDNALNPKLSAALIRHIVDLATKYGKQVICTTHNPAVLDGLNLHADEERLYTVQRDPDGHTVVHRVRPPKPQPGERPVKLSEAFMRGLIGGLPEHF